jgi:uridine kinase
LSAVGHYQDAYDLAAAFARLVLDPLGPGGDCRYRPAILDLATDVPIDDPPRPAPVDAVVLVDGTFLHHPSLAGRWDEVVFLDTDFDLARARAVRRDSALIDGAAAADQAYRTRYHAACRLYLADVDPVSTATIVINNGGMQHPVLRRLGGRSYEQP